MLKTCSYNIFFLTLKQAVARGLKDPSFRVIQNHFAISGNLGEVAAKVQSYVTSKTTLISGNIFFL